MATQRRYQQLVVWQKAIELVTEIYRISARFPESEKYGLSAQMRRASVSLPSNIAEGAGRGSDKEFVRFLQIARGSLFELETQLEIACRLNLIDEIEKVDELIHGIFAMLNNLIQKLKV